MVDAHLRRPYLDEFLIGFDYRPSATWCLRLIGLTREERRLIAPVNVGVPLSAYDVTFVPDPGEDFLDPSDNRQLPIFSRRPEAFAADRYVLTNPEGMITTFGSVELTVSHATDRFWMMAGATAGQSSGSAAARGFQVFQNDGALLSDLFLDPNALTYARGRFFSDRGYTIKTSGTYRFPHHLRLGVVARYQDGQPFSRLVLAPDLGQGAEAIRAYRSGRTRFAYTLTVDTRAQVGFDVGKQHLALVWDVFNLLNLSNEVEESVVTGPAFRTSTALQPPRSMHLGLRIGF
jgi:hypothetical protein